MPGKAFSEQKETDDRLSLRKNTEKLKISIKVSIYLHPLILSAAAAPLPAAGLSGHGDTGRAFKECGWRSVEFMLAVPHRFKG